MVGMNSFDYHDCSDRQKSQALADFSMYLYSRIVSIEEWAEKVEKSG
jgi:hypothetical protein